MENNNKNKKVFSEIRGDIIKALEEKMKSGKINVAEKVTLVDGFFMQNFQEGAQSVQLGGKAIPSIMLVGEDSGQIYFFAIKALLPDLDL